MNIAIIGYGRMGHEIEAIAIERGHKIVLTIDNNNQHDLSKENLANVDVAIEFTTPATAFENVKTCLNAGIPIVCGTTGWIDKLQEAKALAEKSDGALFFASNYSIGVNLFFRINNLIAKYIEKVKGFDVSIEETHHTQKKDAPSGTAITLAEIVSKEISSLKGWTLLPETEEGKIPIEAIREENVTGNHTVFYNSDQDEIVLTHRAKSRRGFALGAVLAAEYSKGKTGFLTMDSFLKL
ncbi:MAG: 4-hydroxy-tetrahydrodipicolinate reductase [Bacteroidetes bacterium HGW-Bacteroidetes-15]|nr:MAG: 4-hydroxy-tetrahydrodipicolinate reductase [Bacteroidetes bacterium HGW-Bacteroidetes-15]